MIELLGDQDIGSHQGREGKMIEDHLSLEEVNTHFGVTIDFCGRAENIGPSDGQDKLATDSRIVNCFDCQEAMNKIVTCYALRGGKEK